MRNKYHTYLTGIIPIYDENEVLIEHLDVKSIAIDLTGIISDNNENKYTGKSKKEKEAEYESED